MKATGQKDHLGSIWTHDATALMLHKACSVLLDDKTPNACVRRAIFNLMAKNELTEAMGRITSRAELSVFKSWATCPLNPSGHYDHHLITAWAGFSRRIQWIDIGHSMRR